MADNVGVRLTGDNSAFKAMLGDSADAAQKFGGDLTRKVGGKLFELRDVSTAIATALGINITNITDHFARLVSGMSKETEGYLKELDKLSETIANKNIATMRAARTEEQNYQKDLEQRAKLFRDEIEVKKQLEITLDNISKKEAMFLVNRKQAEASAKAVVDLKKIENQLADVGAAITTYETKQKKEQTEIIKDNAKYQKEFAEEIDRKEQEYADDWIKNMDRRQKALWESMSTEDQIASLMRDQVSITESIKDAKTEGKDVTQLEASLFETNNALAAKRNTLAKDQKKAEEDVSKEMRTQTRILEDQIIKRRGTEAEGQSKAALEGVRDRLQSELDRVRAANAIAPRSQQNAMQFALESELRQVLNELSSRQSIGNFANRFGEDAARRQFGDTLTDRALREMQDATTRTAVTIERIEQRMQKSPLFNLS